MGQRVWEEMQGPPGVNTSVLQGVGAAEGGAKAPTGPWGSVGVGSRQPRSCGERLEKGSHAMGAGGPAQGHGVAGGLG